MNRLKLFKVAFSPSVGKIKDLKENIQIILKD
jgi:hypothetical protein